MFLFIVATNFYRDYRSQTPQTFLKVLQFSPAPKHDYRLHSAFEESEVF